MRVKALFPENCQTAKKSTDNYVVKAANSTKMSPSNNGHLLPKMSIVIQRHCEKAAEKSTKRGNSFQSSCKLHASFLATFAEN